MNLAESLGFVPQKTARAVRAINVRKLIPNPANFYHIGSLDELKASILEDGGVRQNLIVEPKGDGTYIIISGHRRCQAVKELLADGADVEADLPCEIEPDHAKAERLLIRANSAARILTPWEEVLQAQRADVRHYKDMNGISNKPADDPRQTTIMDFIDDKPAEEPAEETRPMVEAGREPERPAAVEVEHEPENEVDAMDSEENLALKEYQTVAESVWQRTCSLWRLHDKYVNGNITTENYIAESQYEARTLYQELDHLRVLHEKTKKNKGERENQ